MNGIVARLVAERIALLRSFRATGVALLLAVVLVSVVGSLVPALTATAVAWLVSRVQQGDGSADLAILYAPLTLFAVVLVLGNAAEAAREPLYHLTRMRIDGAHRRSLSELITAAPTIGALEGPQAQTLIREAKADPDNWTQRTPADGALAQLRLLASGIGLAGSCVVLTRYAWWPVPLLVLSAFTFRFFLHRHALRWYRQAQRGLGQALHGDAWEAAITSPSEGKDARVFGFGDWAVDRMLHHVRGTFEPVWGLGNGFVARLLPQTLVVVVPLGVVYTMVASSAASGTTSVAVTTAVLAAGWSLFQILGNDDARELIGATACLAALDELRDLLSQDSLEPRKSAPPAAIETCSPPLVRFDRVSFAYPRTERQVLDGLDLEIRPGELLAVVGMNGAGKSTLIKLLAGLYRPTAGSICADGTELADLGPEWRRRISVVFQDFVRYQLPAADNVTLGRPGAAVDPGVLDAVAREAGLDAVVADLPDGWQTPLSRSRSGGVDLSGGQWQQVAHARALYAVRMGAKIVVLDEPTAHLDVGTETEVFQQLTSALHDTSVVLISHRLSTVRRAHRIVLLEDGRISESGTHAELMRLGGSYARMFSLQAERFRQGHDDRIEEGELI